MVWRVHVYTIKIFKWTRILIGKKNLIYLLPNLISLYVYSTCTIEILNALELKSLIEDLFFCFPFQRTVMVPSPICYVVSAPWRELL